MLNLDLIVKRQGELHRVTASNGQPIHADLISLASAEARRKFAAEVGRLAQGIPPAEVEAELLRLAVEDSQKDAKTPSGAITPVKSAFEGISLPSPRAPFPTHTLPTPLRGFVCAMASAMGVPPEVVALPALAVCAAAVGNSCRCWINPSWQEPAILWVLTLMESGSLKTPPYKEAMKPLILRQAEAENEYRTKQERYEQELARYEVDFTAWKKSQGAGDAPVKPEPPIPSDLYTSDCTVEGIALLLQANPRGIILARDELSGFLASFGQYKHGRGGDEAAYLESYSGGAVKVNRAGGKRLFVPHASLSIAGTCQPKVFEFAIRGSKDGEGNQIENGMAARFLVIAPIMPPKKWNNGTLPAGVREGFSELVGALLEITLNLDDVGNAQPRDILMDAAAQRRFATFVNEWGAEKELIEDAALRYHHAKLEGMAARLALILHLIRVVSGDKTAAPGNVDLWSVENGISLAGWFAGEARRVYARLREGPGERLRRELVELIQRRGGTITARELARASRRYRDPGEAESALGELVAEGLGSWESIRQEGPGRPANRFNLTGHTSGDGDTMALNFENPGISSPSPGEYTGEPGEGVADA